VVVGNPIFSLVLGLARLSLVGEVLERYFVNFRYPGKYLTRITSRESASMAAQALLLNQAIIRKFFVLFFRGLYLFSCFTST
jgi:hypothetical protein